MRFLIPAAVALSLGGSGHASPGIPWTDNPYQRCLNNNFRRTNAILGQGARMGDKIRTELEKPAPSWAKLRQLIIELRRNDILFRNEIYRVELKCLDAIPAKDRISSLKRDFRKAEPPRVISVEPPHK